MTAAPPEPRARQADSGSNGRQITQIDADQDGFVSIEEMTTAARKQRGGEIDSKRIKDRFNSIDSNNDGKLSPEKLEDAPRGNGRRNTGGQGSGLISYILW